MRSRSVRQPLPFKADPSLPFTGQTRGDQTHLVRGLYLGFFLHVGVGNRKFPAAASYTNQLSDLGIFAFGHKSNVVGHTISVFSEGKNATRYH